MEGSDAIRKWSLERLELLDTGKCYPLAEGVSLRSRLYGKPTTPTIKTFAPQVPCIGGVPFSQVLTADFSPTSVGETFGPAWSTHWFKIEYEITDEWVGKELHLLWKAEGEAAVFSATGVPLQGITAEGQVRPYVLAKTAVKGTETLFVEMGCNALFGCGPGLIAPPAPHRRFALTSVEIAVFNRDCWDLLWDFIVVADAARHLPSESVRGRRALSVALRMADVILVDDESTWTLGRRIAQEWLGVPLGQGQHRIAAIGHCHIDTAWLWPYAETKRKCMRSWSHVVRVSQDYPEFVFTASQAQQFEWVKEQYPGLFAEIKGSVRAGRFAPVGGSWVEFDGNIPSGEAVVRQFLYGQQFFQQEFGDVCEIFFMPDTFGYSAQLPQLMRGAGIRYFVSTKMSWNMVNKFPHSTFIWEGLDGSSVLTHFPPLGDYNSDASVKQVLENVEKFQNKEQQTCSMLLYGQGDGGGGPTREMMERLRRMSDVSGLPRVTPETPVDFFQAIMSEAKRANDPAMCELEWKGQRGWDRAERFKSHDVGGGTGPGLPRWNGELYLEMHRGTLTSQAAVKAGNRACERVCAAAECVSVVAATIRVVEYPHDRLSRLWKDLLTQQFHDVLPGSCISMVAQEAKTILTRVNNDANGIVDSSRDAIAALCGGGLQAWNELSWERHEVCQSKHETFDSQPTYDGNFVRLVTVPAMGWSPVPIENPDVSSRPASAITRPGSAASTAKPASVATVVQNGDGSWTMANGILTATVDDKGRNAHFMTLIFHLRDTCLLSYLEHYTLGLTKDCRAGRVMSLVHEPTGRHVNVKGAQLAQLQMYRDVPLFWDAWDIEFYHESMQMPLAMDDIAINVLEQGPVRCVIEVLHWITKKSCVTTRVTLSQHSPVLEFDTTVDWHEKHMLLKTTFPVAVRNEFAEYECAFGFIRRPTHRNTSWDRAKFEGAAHTWVNLSESQFGVAILNDCKYGHAVHGNVMTMSLLRSPTAPDASCDIGAHRIRYAIYPHSGSTAGDGDVTRVAHAFNRPLTITGHPLSSTKPPPNLAWVTEVASGKPLLTTTCPSVLVSALKRSEDGSGIIVRLYETSGGSFRTQLVTNLPIRTAQRCNLLEKLDTADSFRVSSGTVDIGVVLPFQVLTYFLTLDRALA